MSEERRNNERVPAGNQVLVEVHGGQGESMTCLACDISKQGLRLLLSEPIELAAGVSVWTKPKGTETPVELKGHIRWSASAPQEGKYWVGVQLDDQTPGNWHDLFSG